MVEGVTAGYEKRLEIQGVGYRAQLKGKNLELAVGYSHPVPIPAPDGHRVRSAPADAGRRQGHLQAARRRDRRDHPQAAPARALQGQGHPLRGRVRGARSARGHERMRAGSASSRSRQLATLAVPYVSTCPCGSTEPHDVLTKGRRSSAGAGAGEDLRHRDAAADLGVPLQPRPLGAADRRRRPGARWRRSHWFEPELRALGKAERRHARRRSCSPSGPRPRASPRPCSIAAATATTATSARFAEAIREAGSPSEPAEPHR